MPFVTEGYVDINPDDAEALGRRGRRLRLDRRRPVGPPVPGLAEERPKDYKVARLLCRARYYPGTPRGVTRMWFNMYGATPGSSRARETRPDGLAQEPAHQLPGDVPLRLHQSATRGWLKPTWMTDSLVRKELFGQVIGKGFVPDVHCPTGAPREAIVKITKAEAGGIDGKGLWRPARRGLRPRYESEALKKYLAGGFVTSKKTGA